MNAASQFTGAVASVGQGGGDETVCGGISFASYHDAGGPGHFKMPERPIEVVEIRYAHNGVRSGVLKQQRAPRLRVKVVGSVPKATIEDL